ncbi:colanic acid biosynthesis glycosyl transferase WcaI [Micromonospora sp. A200]|uniref:glycosyltransferase family 4 protein n=1 Tax=Micromonospora sp. A200 TaxID=2940568 RepID=UPI0024732E2D|nr:glycosyltransferase family 4 protein [Micromonospora sp. A200]MDH6463133.1 colanic acid biosynthesis glycosyl transferase WcaI [Micromonospora sp. A200]
MRVTILGGHYAPEPTGNAPYTAGLANGLVARGHDVRVITSHPHYPEWRVRESYGGWSVSDEVEGVRVQRLAHYVPARPSGGRRLLSELSLGIRFLAARWHRPDVVLLVSPNLITSALAALRARRSRGLATGIWIQDLYSLGITETGQGGRSAATALKALESRTLRSATGVVVIHDRFHSFVTEKLGVPAGCVEVIRNWSHVDPPMEVDRAAVRNRRGWDPDVTVILHAGNMGAKQGLENVVEAARLADRQRAPVRFVLLGDGNQRARLQSLARNVTSIEFVAPLPDDEFRQTLGSADILLVNERTGMKEMSVPSKLTTYYSASLPVLAATDEASVTASEIDASGGGTRVAAGDPQALLDAALSLRADPARARALGAAGRRFRDTALGRDAALDHFEQWLVALAADRHSRARGRRSKSMEVVAQ